MANLPFRAKRRVQDATLTLFNLIASHLETSGTVRVLVMDFSSAFDTIQTCVLIKKLLNLEVNPDLILWIMQCLCDRRQCILSSILFSINMNDISSNDSFLDKYADDMALVGRLKDEHSLSEYLLQMR